MGKLMGKMQGQLHHALRMWMVFLLFNTLVRLACGLKTGPKWT